MKHPKKKAYKPGIDWEKAYSIIRKRSDYKKIITDQQDPKMRMGLRYIRLGLDCDDESFIHYQEKLNEICGKKNTLRVVHDKERSHPEKSSIPNANGKFIDRHIVDGLVCSIVDYRQIILSYKTKPCKRSEVNNELTTRNHRAMLTTFRKLLYRVIEINDTAPIPGIDCALAAQLHESLIRVEHLVRYYQHLLSVKKVATGPHSNDAINQFLLFLHLYLQFEGGYTHDGSIEIIDTLLTLADLNLEEMSPEIIQSRIARSVKLVLKGYHTTFFDPLA